MDSRILGLIAVAAVAVSSNAKADDLAAVKQEVAQSRHQHAELLRRLETLEKRQATSRQSLSGQTAAGQAASGQSVSGQVPQPAPDAFVGQAVRAPLDALASDGPLKWHGITLFGVLDAGVAWQSHGAPFNGYYPQGLEYAISKNSNRSLFSVAPGGMGYSGVGLKGEEEILPDLAGVFGLNTNFNVASGQLSNGPASLIQNNGVPLAYQSANGISARAGQRSTITPMRASPLPLTAC